MNAAKCKETFQRAVSTGKMEEVVTEHDDIDITDCFSTTLHCKRIPISQIGNRRVE